MKLLDSRIVSCDTRLKGTWVGRLDELFAAVGFVSAQKDLRRTQDFLLWLTFSNDLITATYAEVITGMSEGAVKEDLQIMYRQAAKESFEGCAWNAPRFNVIGKKQ